MSETSFPNVAGKPDIDDLLAAELDAAGIEVHRLELLRDEKSEINTAVVGALHGWSFKRAWYYWCASGPGIEIAAADRLYAAHKATVRVAGHCGCPSPREWYKGLAVGDYHVDSAEGLRALADTIRSLVAPIPVIETPTTIIDADGEAIKKLRGVIGISLFAADMAAEKAPAKIERILKAVLAAHPVFNAPAAVDHRGNTASSVGDHL